MFSQKPAYSSNKTISILVYYYYYVYSRLICVNKLLYKTKETKELRKGLWRSPYLSFLLLSFSSKEDTPPKSQTAAYHNHTMPSVGTNRHSLSKDVNIRVSYKLIYYSVASKCNYQY